MQQRRIWKRILYEIGLHQNAAEATNVFVFRKVNVHYSKKIVQDFAQIARTSEIRQTGRSKSEELKAMPEPLRQIR